MNIIEVYIREKRIVRVLVTNDPSFPLPNRKVIFNRRAMTSWGFTRNQKKAAKKAANERARLERLRSQYSDRNRPTDQPMEASPHHQPHPAG